MVWDKDYGESDFYFYSLLCVCHRCMLAQTSRDLPLKKKVETHRNVLRWETLNRNGTYLEEMLKETRPSGKTSSIG